MQPNTIPLFHFSSVGVEGSMLTALFSVLVRVLLLTHFYLTAYCLQSPVSSTKQVSALLESCGKGAKQPQSEENHGCQNYMNCPYKLGITCFMINCIFVVCWGRDTRYPKTGMEQRNKLIFSFFRREQTEHVTYMTKRV